MRSLQVGRLGLYAGSQLALYVGNHLGLLAGNPFGTVGWQCMKGCKDPGAEASRLHKGTPWRFPVL
jgi:hypothetical protein